MTDLAWDEAFSVGIPVMDQQHRKLLALGRAFAAALTGEPDPPELTRALDTLLIYARYHFASEERLLAEAGFPDLAGHCASHRRLTTQLLALRRRLKTEGAAIGPPLLSFLRSWLLEHVLDADKRYSLFLREGQDRMQLPASAPAARGGWPDAAGPDPRRGGESW